MKIYDITCGECGNEFKTVEGVSTCIGCGYVLTDSDIANVLDQASKENKKGMVIMNNKFKKGDKVELMSNSCADSGYKSGMMGTVVDFKETEVNKNVTCADVRVAWDNDLPECWMDANDLELDRT